MKRISLILLIILPVLISCKKEDDYRDRDDEIIRNYLEAEGLTAQKSASGLYYIIENPGNFPKPTINSVVIVHYSGMLTNKKVFDSTTGDNPARFPLSGVIDGWKEGIQYFGEGGSGWLFIPSHLGYGSTIQPGIPANSVLIFQIHLIKVE